MPFSSSPINFTVRRSDAVLVAPSRPTPREFKLLSDIDDQQGLRFQIPFIQFYRNHPSMACRDPARVIRDALAEALVFYYPFAGRLREGAGQKLVVECTGEGVVFIEAEADVSLKELGDDDSLQPPFPWLDEVLFDVPGTAGIINCPLLLVQVTRLTCGGFIFALRLNHAISDGPGAAQFMSAVAELARGERATSVPPVWDRQLLSARNPPRVTCRHREYEQVDHPRGSVVPPHRMAQRSFFFGPREIAALRSHLPPNLRTGTSTFDLLTACFWRCRTLAIRPQPDEQVRMICVVDTRGKFQPPLPAGYYGSAGACTVAMASAGDLCRNPVGYAVEQVSRAKKEVTVERVQSVAYLMPHFADVGTCLMSDLRHVKFGAVDFGWGRPVYGGPAKAGVGIVPGSINFFLPLRDDKDGIVLLCCLPGPEPMARLSVEIERMVISGPTERPNSAL